MDKLELVAYRTLGDFFKNKFNSDDENSIFYHPYYKLVGNPSRYKKDAAGQDIVDLNFEIQPRGTRWETDEALEYLAFVVGVLRSVYQCGRIAVNYDTAHSSASLKRHCTVNVVYVMKDFAGSEIESVKKLASFLRLNGYFNITNAIGNGVHDDVPLLE